MVLILVVKVVKVATVVLEDMVMSLEMVEMQATEDMVEMEETMQD